MNRDHTVPLSDEALSILEMMKSLSGNREFIFPSRIKPSKPMNSQTVNAALKRAGFSGVLVSHGLRSIASTALNEQGFPPDVIEAALAHVDKNEVRRAYNCSDYIEQRRPMMQWWADFIKTAESRFSLRLTFHKALLCIYGENFSFEINSNKCTNFHTVKGC